MRAPSFWWRPKGAAAGLLAPLGAIYGAVAESRMARPGVAAGVPVVCIGNPTLGGAGKTPAALLTAGVLAQGGFKPAFLTRGYGGREAGPVLVDPARHDAEAVGDEPLLLARVAPTIVARDRVAGAGTARATGAGAIVMDDGFQNPSLVKDLSILVVDGGRGIGNGRIFPAGPLRAPLDAQLAFAQALLVIGEGKGAEPVVEAARKYGLALFRGRLEPDAEAVAALSGNRILAFAGIGDPDKVFATLAAAGIVAEVTRSFPDHHPYGEAELRGLLAEADSKGLTAVTTEKDWVRLARWPGLAARIRTLPVRLVIAEAEDYRRFVLAEVERRA